MRFSNRQSAGILLAGMLSQYHSMGDIVVYALPRGGVPVALCVAKACGAPLDLIITRKIGHPSDSECAVGAITEDGEVLWGEETQADIDADWRIVAVESEKREALRRRATYCGKKERISARDKIAIIVDDGAATGLTMRAAIKSLRKEKPKELVVAVPVAPEDTINILREEADTVVVCAPVRELFHSVGSFYDNFSQVTDDEVVSLLQESSHYKK